MKRKSTIYSTRAWPVIEESWSENSFTKFYVDSDQEIQSVSREEQPAHPNANENGGKKNGKTVGKKDVRTLMKTTSKGDSTLPSQSAVPSTSRQSKVSSANPQSKTQSTASDVYPDSKPQSTVSAVNSQSKAQFVGSAPGKYPASKSKVTFSSLFSKTTLTEDSDPNPQHKTKAKPTTPSIDNSKGTTAAKSLSKVTSSADPAKSTVTFSSLPPKTNTISRYLSKIYKSNASGEYSQSKGSSRSRGSRSRSNFHSESTMTPHSKVASWFARSRTVSDVSTHPDDAATNSTSKSISSATDAYPQSSVMRPTASVAHQQSEVMLQSDSSDLQLQSQTQTQSRVSSSTKEPTGPPSSYLQPIYNLLLSPVHSQTLDPLEESPSSQTLDPPTTKEMPAEPPEWLNYYPGNHPYYGNPPQPAGSEYTQQPCQQHTDVNHHVDIQQPQQGEDNSAPLPMQHFIENNNIDQDLDLHFGRLPQPLVCPSCGQHVTTRVRPCIGLGSKVLAGVLCVLLLWPCVPIPLLWEDCMDAQHSCPACGTDVGRKQLMECCGE